MFLKTLGVVFSLVLASCATNVPLSSAVEINPAGAKLSFLDISKFDRDLSGSLLLMIVEDSSGRKGNRAVEFEVQ